MSDKIRLFIAIELPENVKHEIARVQAVLKQARCFEGKYVNPEQAHITMKFIGSVVADQVDVICERLQQISYEPCTAQIEGLGIFVTDAAIKIMYMNIVAPKLSTLAAQLDEQLLPWVKPEHRDFISHVTLARVKHVPDKQRLYDMLDLIVVQPITFEINAFVLQQSILAQSDPEYKMVARFCCSR